MTVSLAIMAQQQRAPWVAELVEQLGGVPVAWDLRLDRGPLESVWPIRREAMLAFEPGAALHVVLQDDAILCRDFRARTEALVEREGAGIAYSLYYRHDERSLGFRFSDTNPPMRVKAESGLELGGFRHERLAYGVAIVLPTAVIPRLVADCDRMEDIRQDDHRINVWLQKAEIPVFYPLPSLVDHRSEGEGRNGPNGPRVATWFE